METYYFIIKKLSILYFIRYDRQTIINIKLANIDIINKIIKVTINQFISLFFETARDMQAIKMLAIDTQKNTILAINIFL